MLELPRVVYIPGGWKHRPERLSFPFPLGDDKGIVVHWSYWKEDVNTGGLFYTLDMATSRPLMPYRVETKSVWRWSEFLEKMTQQQKEGGKRNGVGG
jgi:hypothetical protein